MQPTTPYLLKLRKNLVNNSWSSITITGVLNQFVVDNRQNKRLY